MCNVASGTPSRCVRFSRRAENLPRLPFDLREEHTVLSVPSLSLPFFSVFLSFSLERKLFPSRLERGDLLCLGLRSSQGLMVGPDPFDSIGRLSGMSVSVITVTFTVTYFALDL